MWENMVDKIKMDKAFEYKLSKPYHEYSQVELANEVIAHKGTEDTKIVIEHNGEVYVLYTIGCNSAEDFLNKYRSVLEKIGLSYEKQEEINETNSFEKDLENAINDFNKSQNVSNYVAAKGTDSISINNLFEEMLVKKVNLNQDTVSEINGVRITTEGCQNITDMYSKYTDLLKNLNSTITEQKQADSYIEIDLDNSKALYDNFIVMLNKKRETNQDVVLSSGDVQFTTEGCQSIEDMIEKYSFDLKSDYARYLDDCLNDKNIQNAKYMFRVGRGNRYDGTESDVVRQHIASEIHIKTEEYQKLFNKKNELDFSNPHAVYDWVKSLAPYINTHALTLPVGLKNISYQTQDQLLLGTLRDNGYVDDGTLLHYLRHEENFYKYMVIIQMQQLRDYHFIPTEYNNVDASSLALTTQVVKDEAKLLKYKEMLVNYRHKLEDLNNYEIGVFESKGGNLGSRIAKLEYEIDELNSIKDNSYNMEEISNSLKKVTTIIENLRDKGELKGSEIVAVDSFIMCQRFPTLNDITNALNFAKNLPDNSKVKDNLIDGIINLTCRYSESLDEDEIKIIEDNLSEIGVSLGLVSSSNKSSIESEIQLRLDEIQKLKDIKEQRVNMGENEIQETKSLISRLETEIQKLNVKLRHVVPNETVVSKNEEEYDFDNLPKDSIFNFLPIVSIKAVSKKLYGSLYEKFKKLLSDMSVKKILERDLNLTNDEYDEDDMTVEETVDKDEVTTEEAEYDFDNLKKDSKLGFIPIKEIKEIPKNLHDKISGRFSSLIDRFKKNKSKNDVSSDEKPFWEDSKLEEIANEGSIFTDESMIDKDHSYLTAANAKNLGYLGDSNADVEYDLDNLKKDSVFNFTPIQSVKKVTKKLYDKISNHEFKSQIMESVDTMKKHIMPTMIAVGLPIIAATAIVATHPSEFNNNVSEENSIEDSMDNEIAMGTIEEDIQNTVQENIGGNVSFDDNNQTQTQTNTENNESVQPETASISFDEASQDAISGTLTGESTVYTNAYDAASGINGIDTSSLYGPSWENATAGTYYTIENGTLENISMEQAMENYNSGESVIQRVDNNGVPIGFVEFDNQQENSSGIVK